MKALALVLLLAATPASAGPYKAPRTAFGAPDLQGEWTNLSNTRLQRPKRLKGPTATAEEEAAYLAIQRGVRMGKPPPASPDDPPPAADDPPDVGDLESEIYELDGVGLARIDGQRRTSWIVDPPDGKLPYSAAGKAAAEAAERADEHDFRGPEGRMGDERCLSAMGSATGPPMLNPGQNANYLIFQTPTEVAIFMEMIHDVRIVRLGGEHATPPQHLWMGDSIGWWEGDTLVVETVDQNAGGASRFLAGGVFHVAPSTKVTERFRRTSATEIRYDFLVEDAAIYTQAWRGEMVFNATTTPIYEYACHEGNYALPNILGGAREQEKAAPTPR